MVLTIDPRFVRAGSLVIIGHHWSSLVIRPSDPPGAGCRKAPQVSFLKFDNSGVINSIRLLVIAFVVLHLACSSRVVAIIILRRSVGGSATFLFLCTAQLT